MVTVPSSCWSLPAIILIILDLPVPLLAISAILSPWFNPKLRPSNKIRSP